MDGPLLRLAQASGLATTGDHEWPEHVDEDIAEFVAAPEARAIFVVEQADGLIIGPPPKMAGEARVLAIAKPEGLLSTSNWDREVVALTMPVNAALFRYLHSLTGQVILPLLDAPGTSESTASTRNKLVEAERALTSLLQHQHVAFVDLVGGWRIRAKRAVAANDLNELQAIANAWKRALTQLASSDRDIRQGSASDEAGFWAALEDALRSAEAQLRSPDVTVVVDTLERAKRFHATHNFVGDTGLPETITRVTGYQLLFKDLALGELLASQSFLQLASAIDAVFAQISRRLRVSGYPIERSVLFVEAVGRDFANVLARLADQSLDELLENGGEFPVFARNITELSEAWDGHVRDFASLARDLMRKRAERFVVVRIASAHTELATRVKALENLWSKHRELHPLVGVELDSAFDEVMHTKGLLQLDNASWKRLEATYARAAHTTEQAVAQSLRMKLEQAGSDTERFEVFAQHRAVLSRPEVRAIVHQFQTALAARIRSDLVDLQIRTRAIPPKSQIVRRVISMRALELRVEELLSRTAAVLGTDWRAHAEGSTLAADCGALQSQLDTKKEVDEWSSHINLETTLEGPVFVSKGGALNVSLEPSHTHSDLRALRSLGFRFEPAIIQFGDTQGEQELLRSRLLDSVNDLYSVGTQLSTYPRIKASPAVHRLLQQTVVLVRAGLTEIKWESEHLLPFMNTLEQTLMDLGSRVAQIASVDADIATALQDATIPPQSLRTRVQKLADTVSISEYSQAVLENLARVVNTRCGKLLTSWHPPKVIHRIEIRNQVIVVVPELSATKEMWIKDLNLITAPVLSVDKQLTVAYSRATAKIAAELRAAHLTVAVWLAFQPLWDLRVESVLHELGNDVSKWISVLTELRGMRIKLHTDRVPHDSIQLDTTEARTLVDARSDVWQDELVSRLSDLVASRSIDLMAQSHRLRDKLEGFRPDMNALLPSILILSQTKTFLSQASDQVSVLQQADQLFTRSRFAFPQNWIYADQLTSEVTALRALFESRSRDRDAAKPRLVQSLRERLKMLSSSAQHLLTSWLANKPLQATVEADAALQVLSRFKLDYSKLDEEISSATEALSSLQGEEDQLNPQDSSLTDLDEILKEIERLESSWSSLRESWSSLKKIGNRRWFETSMVELKRDLNTLKAQIHELPQRTQKLPAYENLVRDVDSRIDACEQITLLRESTAIQVTHLSKLTARKLSDDPLLDDIWLWIPERAAILAMVENAEGEVQLTKYMEDLETKWIETRLMGRAMALRNLDAVIQLAADNIAALSAMRSSPYFSAVSGSVQSWERKLSSARTVFDQFVDVQRQFIYLRGVLSAPSVQAILPNETRRFRIVSDEFTQMYTAAVDSPALEFASENRLASNLGRLLGQLTTLHRSLASFLESQRMRFARFLFVGDDDVLEIVGASLDDWGWKHLPSIFPGVARLEIQQNQICAVVSPEGEKLAIRIDKIPEDNVELLIHLEKAMQTALHSEIKRASASLKAAWRNPNKFTEWLESVPCQAALVSLRAQWSTFIKTGSDSLHGEYASLLKFLAEKKHENSVLASRRREAIIAELSYQSSRLKPHYPELEIQVEIRDESILIRRGPSSWVYGYEYAGIPEVLVRTPMTNDFFFAATAAIAQGLGGSVVGPAGTGKTESVKALGSLFGRRVVVFNCDETFDFNTVARVIRGCASTSGWTCFDEFNRLNRKVLSSVSQLVSDSVSKKTPVFVTMNPGYAGRTLLPPNMRPQFREFVMAAPDSQEIAHVLLYAQGLVDQSIGDAAVSLLSQMSLQASSQKHYDWGLRTLKGILRLCRLLHGSVRFACEIAVRPRLTTEDRLIFDKQMDELFGNCVEKLALSNDVDLSQSSVSPAIRPYVLSLDRFLRLSTGVILLGEPACGKTSVWRELANKLDAEVVVFDPSAMTKRAVFGHLESTTRDWTDGILTAILRKVLNNLRGEQSHPWFLVFDGEVEPDWAETLNSVLDDNRRLTLPTGEILSLPKNVHLIFETTNLDAATPATVSRCAVILLPPRELDASRELGVPSSVTKAAIEIDHAMEFSLTRAVASYRALDLDNKYLALAWALAGDSSSDGRETISQLLRESTTEDLPPGDLTKYYVSALTGQWHLWSESIAPSELPPDAITKPEVVVPTADTGTHEALLQAALRSRRPLLLVGPPGSGKTMTLFNALRQLPQLVLIPINFSATSEPDLIVKALELHCEYSISSDGFKVLAPAGTRWAALFIDEINLPSPNINGVVPTIQFLRFIVEHGGFRDARGEFVRLERVQLVGACNPPPGRRELPQRFLRHLAIVQVGYPSLQSLHTIYASFLGGFGADILTGPMLKTYERINASLPGEIWTPRELTRWTRGIYTAWEASSESKHSSTLLLQLWFLEGKRVLADRLDAEHQQIVSDILTACAPEEIALPGVWTYIMTQRPQFMTLHGLRDFLSSRLSVFVEEAANEGDSTLVIHDQFVEHTLRMDRILRQPQGHALLVGPHCTGKVTIVRYVCWLSGLEVVRLRSHARYGDSDFTRDLRRVLLSSVRRPLCFIVSEDTLLEPVFVERMNSLLANGEVPGLFDTHELAAELEDACRRAGFTGGDITPWFRRRVVSNLHVVFTTTTLKGMSPALLNRCYVDQVNAWDTVAKRQIAQYWVSATELRQPVVDAMSMLPCTDNEFLEFCFQVSRTYNEQTRELEDTQRHFVSGGDRLKEAVLEIAQLKRKLNTKRIQLDAENGRSAQVLSQMLQNQSEAERKRVSAVEIRAAVQAQTAQIEKRRSEAHEDLAATEPMLEKAARGVQNIKKAQLNELRGFANPPEPVKITLEAVCIVLGLFTDGSWRQVLTAVRSDEFIPRILRFDSSWLSPEVIRRIEHDYMALPSFTFERVDRASKACGPLLLWVVAQVAYSKALASVQPLLAEVEKLNSQAAESTAQLEAIEGMLGDLGSAIEESKFEYSKAIAQCESIKSEISIVGTQLARSEALLESLKGEQDRWSECAAQFNDRKAVIAGNSYIEAACIALGGGRDPIARRELLEEVKTILDMHEISFHFVTEIASPVIASRSSAVALIVDPANRWDSDEQSKTTSFLLDPDALLKEVDTALRFGQHIVIKHAERYDPLLAPLLAKEYVRRGARLIVNLGGKDVDVAPGFRLTLHGRDRRAIEHSQPHLLSRVTLVDFSVSESTFGELVRNALLAARNQDLAERRTELLELDSTTQKRLRALETQLLNTLSESGDSGLLENAELLHSLETLKTETAQLERVRSNTKVTLADLEEAYVKYTPAAQTAASIYMAVCNIVSWDPFYVVSVDWMCNMAQSCASSDAFEQDFVDRIYTRVSQVVRIEHRKSLALSLQEASGHKVKHPETLSLVQFIEEVPNTVPIVIGMATPKTVDPGSRIVEDSTSPSSIVAMGSNQASVRADRLLGQAVELGEWLIIQNIELAEEDWLRSLARRLQGTQPSSKFRLILSGMQGEIVKMPDLLATGRPVSVESVDGIVPEVRAILDTNSDERDCKICWIHACFSKAFPNANFVHPDLMAARWFAKQISASAPLRAALLIAIYGAKTGDPHIKQLMVRFLELYLVDGETPIDFSTNDWISKLPQDDAWVPSELENGN